MKEKNEFFTVRGYQLLEQDKRLLTPAMEDYIEMIYRNSKEEGYIRIGALAELLNINPSSATKMVQKLSNIGMVDYKKYGIITLTEKGVTAGKYLYKRHKIIEQFLELLGIKENVLIETELIEHNISISTLENMALFNTFIEDNLDVRERLDDFINKHKESLINLSENEY